MDSRDSLTLQHLAVAGAGMEMDREHPDYQHIRRAARMIGAIRRHEDLLRSLAVRARRSAVTAQEHREANALREILDKVDAHL